jgi:hypothetical protein
MATRIGVDIGGTFTNLVVDDGRSGQITVEKGPTTPAAPEGRLCGHTAPGSDPISGTGELRVLPAWHDRWIERTAREVWRSATSGNAELLQMSGQLGCSQPDAYADLPVTKGNPVKGPGLFKDPLANLLLIMKGGVCIRSAL